MSGISSGTGLISGLPTAELIDSIIAQASGPKKLLTERLSTVQKQRSSLLELNARLVSLRGSTTSLTKSSFFNMFSATSSNESILTASASEDASPGVLDLMVKSLVTSHQIISNGFADAKSTPVGTGQITIEVGNGRLNTPTMLGDLNGGDGVRRGKVQITDRAGESAVVDLSAAVDIDDVLQAINTAADINVKARVVGDHLEIKDLSGGEGTLKIEDLKGGYAAADLGIRQSVEGDLIAGGNLVRLADNTQLKALNDGNGVRVNGNGLTDFTITTGDSTSFDVALSVSTIKDDLRLEALNSGNGVRLGTMRITNRRGESGTVDLSSATTIGEVRAIVNAAVDENTGESLNVELRPGVGVSGVAGLTIEDKSEVADEDNAKELIIEDVNGHAARDLGIAGRTTGTTIQGSGVYRIETVGDVVRAINYATGNDGYVVARLTDTGIQLEDTGAGPLGLRVEAAENAAGRASLAAEDLGIAGELDQQHTSRRLIAGLNTVLLTSVNGGQGLELGEISFTPRDGSAAVTVDFSGAETVQEIIDRINANVPGVEASVNAIGTGIAITDTTGATGAPLTIADVSGSLAEQLGIAGTFEEFEVNGVNLQRQYINERTQLETLNAGRGVRAGALRITTADGQSFNIDIDSSLRTMGAVIDEINKTGEPFGVTAAINPTGDGIAITDATTGEGRLTIEDQDGGAVAKDLRLAGTADYGENTIDGSYEIRIDVEADDSLNDVAGKIRDASQDLNATVFNDGASNAPYRLSVTSGVTGKRGEVLFDAGGTNLNMSTLVAAEDAVVLVGGRGADNPIVISSSSNTITDAIPGVELNLTSVSDETVTVATARNVDGVVSQIQKFVDNYNAVVDRIDELTRYDVETETRAVLQSDATVATIETRLTRALVGRFNSGIPSLQTLGAVGIEFGDGARLSFDADKFREKYAEDPAAVEAFFTAEDVGVGSVLDKLLEEITAEGDGLMARRDDVLGDQVDDLNDRIEAMELSLERRRAQLERQYANLESVLAGMQDQQSALSQLAGLAG